MGKRINLLLIMLAFLCCACSSPNFNVLVNGRTSQEYEQNKKNSDKYKIIFDHEKNKDDFDYQLVHDSVTGIFKKNGYHLVENIYDAGYVAFINFTVSEPRKRTINHSTPIIGQTGTTTHTTYTYGPYGAVPHTYTTPIYGTVGYNHYQTTKTFYIHLLSVTAYAFSKPELKVTKKTWQISSSTLSKTNDFRAALPALLLVLQKRMATDTHGDIDVEIYEQQGKLIEEEDLFK
ncbi:MAG: hypothetical protein NC112_05155 [Oxalobacter formigenes]|nr:hypothetical protein [Oxalobacter formigenes]